MRCSRCNSPNVYGQDGEHVCMMCGSRWPVQKEVIKPLLSAMLLERISLLSRVEKLDKMIDILR